MITGGVAVYILRAITTTGLAPASSTDKVAAVEGRCAIVAALKALAAAALEPRGLIPASFAVRGRGIGVETDRGRDAEDMASRAAAKDLPLSLAIVSLSTPFDVIFGDRFDDLNAWFAAELPQFNGGGDDAARLRLSAAPAARSAALAEAAAFWSVIDIVREPDDPARARERGWLSLVDNEAFGANVLFEAVVVDAGCDAWDCIWRAHPRLAAALAAAVDRGGKAQTSDYRGGRQEVNGWYKVYNA
jgi:hypothetical protein